MNRLFQKTKIGKSFQAMFHAQEKLDVVLIQPHLIQSIPDKFVDPVQLAYFSVNGFTSDESFADLPVEANWGLLYIANMLLKHGYRVSYLDFNLYDYIKYTQMGEGFTIFGRDSDVDNIVRKKKAKVFGISCMTCSMSKGIAIAKRIKEIHPNSYVVMGGIHPALFAEELLTENPGVVDFVIKGEGERSFLALLNQLFSGEESSKWLPIPGVCYAIGDKIVTTPPETLNLETEDNPLNLSLWPRDVPFIPRINLSRGCMGSCVYCSANRSLGGGYRTRTMDNILADIDNCYANGYKKIMFGDLSFGCNKELALDVCQHLLDYKINIQWWCQMRLVDCDSELLHLMSIAGCRQIALGFESSSAEILDEVSASKGNARGLHEVCTEIRKLGIGIQGYFVIGLPSETEESAEKTISFMEELLVKYELDYTHISICVPFPGTDLYDNPNKYGITIIDHDFDNHFINSDLKGVALPVFDGAHLTRYQIFALWQKALATAHKHLSKRKRSLLENKYNNIFCEHFYAIPASRVSQN